jgi:formylmethanofuran dehydrogenase subunit E
MMLNIKEIIQGEVLCEQCGEPTEFIGEGEHIKKVMCPYCAVEFTIDELNKKNSC